MNFDCYQWLAFTPKVTPTALLEGGRRLLQKSPLSRKGGLLEWCSEPGTGVRKRMDQIYLCKCERCPQNGILVMHDSGIGGWAWKPKERCQNDRCGEKPQPPTGVLINLGGIA